MLRRLLVLSFLVVLSASAGDLPPYLKEALSHFNPAIPPDLAYTITTQRDSEISVERFDPSLAGERQWTLLQRNHRPATAEENARYGSYRITTSPSTHAAFSCGDIDPNTLRLIHEDEDLAEFRAKFREDIKDPMLHQLELQLTVSKHRAAIERFVLVLTAPYSPVLTVKMLELRVETTLGTAVQDCPALPVRVTSRFRGRVFFFKSIEEDIQTSYSDFTSVRSLRPTPESTTPAGNNEKRPEVD